MFTDACLQDSSGFLDRKELDSFIRDLIHQKSGVSLCSVLVMHAYKRLIGQTISIGLCRVVLERFEQVEFKKIAF